MAINKNLLLNSDFTRGLKSWGDWGVATRNVVDSTAVAGFTKAVEIAITGSNQGINQRIYNLPAGNYTLSYWAKSTALNSDYAQLHIVNANQYIGTGAVTTSWTKIVYTITLSDKSDVILYLGRGSGGGATTNTTLLMTGIKLEEGNTVTNWVPGTEANLLVNTGLLDGTNKWNIYADPGANITSKGIIDDTSVPSSKAYHVQGTIGEGGIWQASSYVNATIGKTYTISIVAKGTGTISYGWEGLKKSQLLTSLYQKYEYTFTYSSTLNYRFYLDVNGGDIYFHSMKMEEGAYATDWISAQADIDAGKDKPVLARAQHTIVDYNDKVSLVSSINSNVPLSQQYSPSEEKFIPDWTQENLVLTSSLYKGDSATDIINSGNVIGIKWYRLSVIDGVNPVQISNDANYSILGNQLTVTQNVLSDKDSIDFICEITYLDPISTQTLLVKSTITFSRVRNGGALTSAITSLPYGNSLQNDKAIAYKKNDSYIGRNLERYTDYISGTASAWSWAGSVTQATKTIINEPTAPTGKALEVLYPETLTGAAGVHKPPITPLVVGKTYSWSVWIKASRDIADINIGQEQGGTKHVALTTSWQKFTNTFTANSSIYYSFIFYTIPTFGDKIWIHSLKLEEGSSSTEWSMAPEDTPTIDQAVGNNNWVLKKYPSVKSGTYTPTYNDIITSRPYITNTLGDSVSPIIETDSVATPYIGHLQTAIYSNSKNKFPLTFQHGGPTSIYANNKVSDKDEELLFNPNASTGTSGRNYALRTATTINNSGANGTTEDYVGFSVSPNFITDVRGKTVTVSAYVEGEMEAIPTTHYGVDICINYTDGTTTWVNLTKARGLPVDGKITGQRYSFTTAIADKEISSVSSVGMFTRTYTTLSYFIIKDLKVEIGSVATPWCPAPEDGGRNLLVDSAKERTYVTEYVGIDITDIARTYLGKEITVSFDLKTAIDGNISCYSLGRYGVGYSKPVVATTSYQRFSMTGIFNYGASPDPNGEKCTLSFYGTYGTGRIPTVKNIKIEIGNRGVTIPEWVPALEDLPKISFVPLEKGWNTIDVLWLSNTRTKNGVWNIQAGGANLFTSSSTFSTYAVGSDMGNQSSLSSIIVDSAGNYQTVKFKNSGNIYFYPKFNATLYQAKTYTISLEVKTNKRYGVYWYPSESYVLNPDDAKAIPNTNGQWQRWSFTYTQTSISTAAGQKLFGFFGANVGDSISFRKIKLERGGIATPWTVNQTELTSANSFVNASDKLNAYYAIPFEEQLDGLIAKCQLQRGSIIDTTNVLYQWYKQDGSVITDQGGGIGWLKLNGSSIETGYNTDTLFIPSAAVDSIKYYKCIICDTQVDSITYNGYFSSIVSVSNTAMPIDVRVETDGTVILNGQVNKALIAKLYQVGREIDVNGDKYIYKWYRYLSNGTKDTTWASGTGYKLGKTLIITNADVATKATFSIEIE